MRFDEKTKIYVERRTAEGLSYREIKRCLKRFLARSILSNSKHLGLDLILVRVKNDSGFKSGRVQ